MSSKIREKSEKMQVVLLHGYGSSGENMQGLATAFSLPNVDFWCPDAPEVCQEYPQGRQWFSLKGLDWKGEQIRSVWPSIHNVLAEAAKKFHTRMTVQLAGSDAPVVLMGFSQGAMMAYQLGFFGPRVKAVIGLAGAYCLHTEPLHRPHLFWAHAKDDTVVPFQWMQQTHNLFTQYGLHAERYISPHGGHSVTLEAVDAVRAFLMKIQESQA